ncbi:MAG: flagellar motor switch phosphatase FliY [Bacillota bacterium]|jgi:flagellar motor switch protein FliN/FliY|nr:flagellar motor switch phosphatase FliY [Bacillota bacterium]
MTNLSNSINLTEMEADIIGEVMNISMGSAATAMSSILDQKVSITTPRVSVSKVEDFEFSHLEPVVGVLIRYIEGIGGFNMLLLKVEDVKLILSHLLGTDPSELNEFDEISMSAICEIMNQMMGAASSALATFLGIKINISPPEVLDTTNVADVRQRFSGSGDHIVCIGFDLDVEGLVKSEFISIMEPQLAKRISAMSLGDTDILHETDQIPKGADPMPKQPEPTVPPGVVPPQVQPPQPAPPVQTAPPVQSMPLVQPVPPAPPTPPVQPPQPVQAAQPAQPAPPTHPVHPTQTVQAIPYNYKPLEPETHQEQPAAAANTGAAASAAGTGDGNLDLIMSVPIQITVELGRTKKKIKDIIEFAPGNIVELDRQAGDQVDIVANGRLIARGDVVVVDDNYSVRITEIMKARDSLLNTK